MRIVLQRVRSASVAVAGECVGRIEAGLLILLGIRPGDTLREVDWLVEKVINLRVFEDDAGKMNRCLAEVGGALLVVSQFTLYGDCAKGRRPSFVGAASPDVAEPLYEAFLRKARDTGCVVECGRFGAEMLVSLVNDGPLTLILDRDAA